MRAAQVDSRLEVRRLPLVRELELKASVEHELSKSKPNLEFCLLINVRMAALLPSLRDFRGTPNDSTFAQLLSVPMLLASVEGDTSPEKSSWGGRGTKVKAHLAVVWEEAQRNFIVRNLGVRGLPCLVLKKERDFNNQVQKILAEAISTLSSGATGVEINCMSRSQRSIVAGPQNPASIFREYQLLMNIVLLQEVKISSIIQARESALLESDEQSCLNLGTLDWVVLRTAQTLKRDAAVNGWEPFLVVEFDGPTHLNRTDRDALKDRLCVAAGLSVLRCTHKDFPDGDGTQDEQQFRREFIHYAILKLSVGVEDRIEFSDHEETEIGTSLDFSAKIAGAAVTEVVWHSRDGYRYAELHARYGSPTGNTTEVLARTPQMKVSVCSPDIDTRAAELFKPFAEKWLLERYIDKHTKPVT